MDLPARQERKEILSIHLRKHDRSLDCIDLERVTDATDAYSGSELEQIVITALYEAFDEDPHIRELSTQQLANAALEIVPLAVTMNEHLDGLREWAKTRARAASSKAISQPAPAALGDG